MVTDFPGPPNACCCRGDIEGSQVWLSITLAQTSKGPVDCGWLRVPAVVMTELILTHLASTCWAYGVCQAEALIQPWGHGRPGLREPVLHGPWALGDVSGLRHHGPWDP
jgi:hypothetical protein